MRNALTKLPTILLLILASCFAHESNQQNLNAAIFNSFLGTYRFPSGKLIVVGRSLRRLYFYEPTGGLARGLQRESPGSDLRWVVGPSVLALAVSTLAQPTNAKVDLLFKEWDRPNSPGCALGVIRNGKFVYKRGYGMADLDHGVPLTPQSVFYIASMSKQFTAASIALLVEQGKLSLEDDIRKYLPEMGKYERPIKIRNLIHHTSGIRDYIVLHYLRGLPSQPINSDAEMYETMALTTNEDVVKLITRQRGLNFLPGAESAYSNSNYILLAEIVKRVSGKPLSQFAEENIFKPLGMFHTHYYEDLMVVVKDRAIGYSPRSDGRFVPVRLNNGTVGPAGILTTVDDLLLWDRNFYQNKLGAGGQHLLDLLLNEGSLNDGTKLHYTFGLYRYKYKGLKAIGHDGGFFGFKTSMNRFPDQKFTVICLCNSRNAPMDSLADEVTDIYLGDQFKLAPSPTLASPEVTVQLSPEELQKFAGIYWNPLTEGLWMLTVKEGKLIDPGAGGSVLLPIDKNRFRVAGQPVELIFETSPQGRILGMFKIIDGGKPQRYEPKVPVAPSPKDLAEYAGRYYSEEIEANYAFVIDQGELTLERQKAKSFPVTPTFADNFWNDQFGYVRFTRNAQGEVDGLLLTSGWIRRLRFVKALG